MKTGYEKELNKVSLHIDLPRLYEEDYQIHMLRENSIPCLLDITGCGMDGKSRYTYSVTGMKSMKTMFETLPVKREDMLCFVTRLMEAVKGLKRYMLNPDGLLLYPEFMFYNKATWFFCYLPGRRKSLCEAFHVITEYFVRKLDYEDTKGIMLAYELHKATLEENYDLEKIIDDYTRHEEKRNYTGEESMINTEEECLPEENLFSLDEDVYEAKSEPDTVRETGGWCIPWKKTIHRLKKRNWGSWRDLIFETDGQEKEEPL